MKDRRLGDPGPEAYVWTPNVDACAEYIKTDLIRLERLSNLLFFYFIESVLELLLNIVSISGDKSK